MRLHGLTPALAAALAAGVAAPAAAAVGGRYAAAASEARVSAASFRPGSPPRICAGDLFADQIGTARRDVLTAGRRAERLWGRAGPDVLYGSPTRATCMFGGRDHDALALGAGGGAAYGEHGSDVLTGTPLEDLLDGGPGTDTLLGGPASDSLIGGPGVDGFAGGDGDDLIEAADDRAEIVDCGDGADLVAADRTDVLLGCEQAARQGGLLRELHPVPRAARRDEIVRVTFRVPATAAEGAYRIVVVHGCGAEGTELTRFPPPGTTINRGRRVRVGLRPPAAGWCTDEVFAAVVHAPQCARACIAPPPPQPIARVRFEAVSY